MKLFVQLNRLYNNAEFIETDSLTFFFYKIIFCCFAWKSFFGIYADFRCLNEEMNVKYFMISLFYF
ncbi:hypothetical protein SAMN04515674_102329 [Pseudarcicella hirudinis]|uniref:Uncharacterized protein n=1 Tax=Pseudarcicella hirudinis TaxID=1079859 RepID=A0A1I5P7N2_9BACT|nr:hypothetical protein SAMN04515674_102329 [Pseudarcicella hirudinis]